MLTYQTFFQSELEKAIKEEIERRTYRHHVGIIDGLRAALELIEDTERHINSDGASR